MTRRRERKPRVAKETLKLPDEKTTPSSSLLDHTYLIFGERKIGKTSLIAQIENLFFLPTEKGTLLQECYQPINNKGKPITLRTWSQLIKWAKLACKSGRYQAICIDTIDQAYKLASIHCCNELGIDHPGDLGYGKGWNAITVEVTKLVDMIMYDYNLGLFMLSHTQYKDVERFDGSEFELFTASLGGKTGEYITGVVDFWAYYGYKGRERRLWIEGSEKLDAGSRFENNFINPDTDKKLAYIPMGNSPEQAYENFELAYNNELEIPKEVKKKKRSRRRKD